MERWRRIQLDVPEAAKLPPDTGLASIVSSGRSTVITTGNWSPALEQAYRDSGAVVRDVQRMNLEEIFVASVMSKRRELEKPEATA